VTQKAFPDASLAQFAAAYPETVVRIGHTLCDHPLLSLSALIELAGALPSQNVEYNPGALPIGIDPKDVPTPHLNIADTIRSIEENGSWMVIKFIEQSPIYRALLEQTLAEIEPLVGEKTGAMLGQEGFIFISSPGAVTPFHFDPEHNILMQIRGSKVMTIFPNDDEALVSPAAHEAFHLGLHHRNLPWQEAFADKGNPVSLCPGEAVYVPVKSPHWVQNGPEVSISLSVTWRSDWSYEEADARAFNHLARKIGVTPASPKRYPESNRAKSLAFRAARRLGIKAT
jgi:hypothetical protein